MSGIKRADVINREIQLCRYFVIVTSAKMTAKEALVLYKNRDGSEKTFRADKSCLGARSERVYSNESVDTKIFIGFVATIIRGTIYTHEVDRLDKKPNYMTVPSAIKELEKIEMLKGADNEYNLEMF